MSDGKGQLLVSAHSSATGFHTPSPRWFSEHRIIEHRISNAESATLKVDKHQGSVSLNVENHYMKSPILIKLGGVVTVRKFTKILEQ
jgi:hypothetical protein